MNESYGFVWQENDRSVVAGKLELGARELRLEGSDWSSVSVYDLPYCDLVAVHVDRETRERLDGRLTVRLERSNGDQLRIAALAQTGILTEIVEQLASAAPGPG